MALTLNIGKCTLLGNYRENNEDSIEVKQLPEMTICLVADGMIDRTLEKLLSRQKNSDVKLSAPILEVNASHPLIRALGRSVLDKGADSISDAAYLLLDQAHVLEGEPIEDPAGFARRLDEVMARAFA